jgi:hypothetical protein
MDDLETKLLREFYSTSSTSTGTKGYTDFLISRIAELEATLTDTKIELGISHKIIKQGGANTAAEAAYIFYIPSPPIDTGSEV